VAGLLDRLGNLGTGHAGLCYPNVIKKQGLTKGSGGKAGASAKVTTASGRDRFGKISKVEGIELTREMRQRADEFDRWGSSAEERRTAIIRAHRKG
jgi:hypothetical protein